MKKFTIKTLNNNYGHIIERYLGLDKEQLADDYSKYTILQPKASVKDYMWSLFNRMILSGGNPSMVYHSMAGFVSIYEGKDGKQYSKLAVKAELEKGKKKSKKTSVVLELEIIGDTRCSIGKKYDGTKYPMDTDLVDLPIAGENCERDSCGCTTALVPMRDADGRLVWKED
jgi:hypothetical protein